MKYEYKVLPVEDGFLEEDALNNLGADEWRLVSVTVAHQERLTGVRSNTEAFEVFTHVFIREKR